MDGLTQFADGWRIDDGLNPVVDIALGADDTVWVEQMDPDINSVTLRRSHIPALIEALRRLAP